MKSRKNDVLFSAHATLAALRSSIRLLRWGMLALVLVYLTSGITIVSSNEVGITLRFGRPLGEVHPPGLLLAFPRPIDQVVLVPVKTVQELTLTSWTTGEDYASVGKNSLHPIKEPYTLTGDANIIRARFTARFQVSDPLAYSFNTKDRESLAKAVIYQCACQVLAGTSVDDALTSRRDFVAQETMRLAQIQLNKLEMGIQLIALEVKSITPPQYVFSAFQDVVSAQVEAKTLVEPAKAYQASAIPQAKAKAFEITQAADAKADEILSQAQGVSASFQSQLKEYQKNPATTRNRLYLETLESILAKARVVTVFPAGEKKIKLWMVPTAKTDAEEEMDESVWQSSPSNDDSTSGIPRPDGDETTPLPAR